jgi:hypothetical protein
MLIHRLFGLSLPDHTASLIEGHGWPIIWVRWMSGWLWQVVRHDRCLVGLTRTWTWMVEV